MSSLCLSTLSCIEFWAAVQPRHRAVVGPGFDVGYAGLHQLLLRVRTVLRGAGLAPGMKVAVCHRDALSHLLLLIACDDLGVATMSFHVQELGLAPETFDGFDAALGDERPAQLPSAMRFIDWDPADLDPRGVEDPRGEPAGQARPSDEIVRITRTSGSTGRPKRLQIRRGAFEHWMLNTMATDQFGQDAVVLVTAPLAVNQVCCCVHAVLRMGRTVALGPLFELRRSHRISHAWYLPAMLDATLAAMPPDRPEPVVERLVTAGSGMSPTQRERIASGFCRYLMNAYGTNEVGAVSLHVDADGIGILGPGVEVRVTDASGVHELEDGESGELWLRTFCMLDGYWERDPELQARFHEGWYRSGDVGRRVGARRLQLLGRADDVLNLGGFKKSASDVEAAFLSDPAVRAAGVVPLALAGAAPRGSQVVVALVLADDAEPVGAVLARIHERHPPWIRFVPVMVMDELPRNSGGKLDRVAIRQAFLTQLRAAGRA